MNFLDTKKIHFIGIGGIGVSALARLFLSRGAQISGSDITDFPDKAELEKRGAEIFIGHDAEHIEPEVETVVYSDTLLPDNPEILEAKRRGIPMFDYAHAVGSLMKDGYYGIAVSGTNGKTTTTAMLGKILEAANLNPLVIVGGKVPGWDKNLRVSSPDTSGEMGEAQKGSAGEKIFLVEGDEYRRHMLALSPRMIVLTNIEADHLDYYQDLADIESAFTEFVKKLSGEDTLVYNADDANTVRVADNASPEVKRVGYSLNAKTDLMAHDISYVSGNQRFSLLWQGENLGIFSLPVPGRFNMYNALAGTAAALALRVSGENIRTALSQFTGTWRRFQNMGAIEKKIIISDYAHHPTAVSGTLQAARELYPGKKILAVFQPHQKDRTKKLLTEFSHAFGGADYVLLCEIFDVAGRDEGANPISSLDLIAEMKKDSHNPPASYVKTLDEAYARVHDIMESFDLVLVMGAGDVHSLAERLVKKE